MDEQLKNQIESLRITKGMEKFLKEDVLPDYIIYSRETKYAFCTACQTQIDIDFAHTKPSRYISCPNCKRESKLSPMSRWHGVHGDKGAGFILDKENGTVCVRYFDVEKVYHESGKLLEYHRKESLREYFNEKGLINAYDNAMFYGWRKCNIRKYSNMKGRSGEPCYHINMNWKIRNHYTSNISRVIKGTAWEKSCMSEIFKLKNAHNYWDTFRSFLKGYIENPLDEQLYKVGLTNLCAYRVFTGSLYTDTREKEMHKILCVKKEYFKKMLKINPTIDELIKYQRMTAYNYTEEEYDIWKRLFIDGNRYSYATVTYNPANDFFEVFPKSFKQLENYANKYEEVNKKRFDVSYYRDYLKTCKRLEYDMKNTFVLFPKDLKLAHDNAVAEWNFKENARKREEAKKRNNEYETMKEKYLEKYSFEKNDLKIVVPNGCEDICAEGQNLHHCVGTYIDRVCKGMSVILFVRQLNKLNTSFYTMELQGNTMIQCRGFGNGKVTPEVRNFIKAFARAKHLKMESIA